MQRYRAALLALVASCYGPLTPEGVPCTSSVQCPSPQQCVVGRCSLHDAPVPDAAIEPDAALPDALDAAIDAMPDAALACVPTGLPCGGTARTFKCGGHCWVSCSGSTGWVQSSQACATWMG